MSTPSPGQTPADAPVPPPLRVLIVDDLRDAADSLAVLLQLLGHEVRAVYDGATALHVAGSFRPEVVMLDIGLPDLDGYEVARRLRQQVNLADALLVAATGFCTEEDRRRGCEAGFDHHLPKPYDFPEVELLLKGKQAALLRPQVATL
jgi:CheY-like chemotaxis protein